LACCLVALLLANEEGVMCCSEETMASPLPEWVQTRADKILYTEAKAFGADATILSEKELSKLFITEKESAGVCVCIYVCMYVE